MKIAKEVVNNHTRVWFTLEEIKKIKNLLRMMK